MFSALKSFIVGDSSNKNQTNILKENKPLKSDVSNNNMDSINNKKKTIIKGEKNEFDFSEEYEDEPKQNINTQSSSSNESISEIKEENIIHNPIQNMDDIDFWRMAHCVYVKNSLININMFNFVPFIKLKRKSEGLLSYIGFGTEDVKELKYLAGFDEHFIYMINLSKEENKNENDAMKTIGNHYDINQITNIEVVQDTFLKNKILITILFVLDNDVNNYISKIKKFYFEKPNALKFLKILKEYLNINKIKVAYIDKVFQDLNFNEIKKEKEGKDKLKKEEIEENNDPKKLPNYKLIKAIAKTLDTILENNKKKSNYKEIVKKQSKMAFSANLIPGISIEDYLLRIQTYANVEESTLIICLIFIDKLCHTADVTLTHYNIHRILFIAVLLSIKYNEDSFFDNQYYSEIAGVKIKELKLLEYTFVSMVDFNLFVSNEIYEKYKNYLDNFDQ